MELPMTYRLPDDLERICDPALLRKPENLTVACWTFPHWHPNPFNDRLYGKGWTEYIQMRGCRPWFPGHHQPRTPLLGELNEREPATWETYIDLARSGGIDVFVFDWYWFDGGPVFHEALEDGFLQAANAKQMRFAAMWTNHPWAIWFPTAGYTPKEEYLRVWETSGLGGYELTHAAPERAAEVWRSLSYIIARYCHLPQYWHLNGEPVLALWDLARLVGEFGLEGARRLLDDLRAFAARLGHQGIYFHAVVQEPGVAALLKDLEALGVQSYSIYNAVAMATGNIPDEVELLDYGALAANVVTQVWPEYDALSPMPCFPNINPGCDNAPRVLMRPRSAKPSRARWPGTPIVIDETPAGFEALARAALAYLNQRSHIPPVLTIGCWNEWTEGHYLLPDTKHGFGMIRALARALG
jgi:hypothetical protein